MNRFAIVLGITLLSFSLSISARATDCPVSFGGEIVGEAFSKKVTDAVLDAYKQSGCEAATNLASSCAMGSSIDLSFFAAATDQCHGEFKNKSADEARFKKEIAKCAKDKSEGTLGMSTRSACAMEAAR
ncbi:MAG: hypothetical protein EBX52_08645, partial [Proteobacteria bacterium]|nr:hypothetical protein [Pseudomonadota bacterium]